EHASEVGPAAALASGEARAAFTVQVDAAIAGGGAVGRGGAGPARGVHPHGALQRVAFRKWIVPVGAAQRHAGGRAVLHHAARAGVGDVLQALRAIETAGAAVVRLDVAPARVDEVFV